jgi:hypothetical protein
MASNSSAVLKNLIDRKRSVCISDHCLASIHRCTSAADKNSPLSDVRLTLESGAIDPTQLEMVSCKFSLDNVISELGRQLWELYPVDVSNCDTIVDSLVKCTTVEVHMFQMLSSKGITCTLLKDAVADPALSDFLPSSLISLCKYIFLPSGTNLRNLLWHGFLLPIELGQSAHFLCIIESISRTLELIMKEQCIPPKVYSSLWRLNYDDLVASFPHETALLLVTSTPTTLLHESLIVLPGRERIFESAFVDFERGRYIRFMLKIIPCLEHALRFLFCLVNNLPDYLLAQENTYYSTLDGFGQKSKHQLLLHPSLYEVGGAGGVTCCKNMLPSVLGAGPYALLIDIFFTETGPNLRGKFAHGEIDMCVDIDSSDHMEYEYSRDMASVLMVLVVALCDKFNRYGAIATSLVDGFSCITSSPSMIELKDVACESESEIDGIRKRRLEYPAEDKLSSDRCFNSAPLLRVQRWESLYHPHRVLSRHLMESLGNILATASHLSLRKHLRVERVRAGGKELCGGSSDVRILVAAECEFLVEIVVNEDTGESARAVGVWEKRNRINAMISDSEFVIVQTCLGRVVDTSNDSTSGSGGGADSRKGTANPNTAHAVTESVSATCCEYIRALKQKVERIGNSDALLCIKSLEQVIYESMRPHLREICNIEHMLVVTQSTMHSMANSFQAAIERLTFHVLGIFTSSLIPGIQCCGQLCKVSCELSH